MMKSCLNVFSFGERRSHRKRDADCRWKQKTTAIIQFLTLATVMIMKWGRLILVIVEVGQLLASLYNNDNRFKTDILISVAVGVRHIHTVAGCPCQ